MAYVKKGYIGDSSVNAKLNSGNTMIKNGEVYKAYGGVGTGGKNLTANAYPSSVGVSSGNTQTLRSAGSSSSGGTKSAGASSSPAASYDYEADLAAQRQADSYNALLAAYQKKQADYEEYLRQRREAAQNAYDRSLNNLNSAYDSQINSLTNNLNETKNQLLNQYNQSKSNISSDAENSLRQAYINRMLSEKNLGQQMSALGLNGGATETTLAGMLNNYGNARNEINTTANKNLSNLENNYNSNLSQAAQAYNSAVANANMQKSSQLMNLENLLSNNQVSALTDYYNLLQKDNDSYLDLLKAAISNGVNFSYDPTAANNAVKAIAYTQASNPAIANNYATIQELMNSQNLPGTSSPGVTVVNPTVDSNYLKAILAQLQGA